MIHSLSDFKVAFELGRIYFQDNRFKEAQAMFKKARKMCKQVSSPKLQLPDMATIQGFTKACEGLTGQIREPTLLQKVELSRKNRHNVLEIFCFLQIFIVILLLRIFQWFSIIFRT